jgi:hypothetical protein
LARPNCQIKSKLLQFIAVNAAPGALPSLILTRPGYWT